MRLKNIPGIIALALAGALFLFSILSLLGCTNPKYAGANVVIGDEVAFPEISNSSETVKVRVFQSVKGAKIWTAKDCRLEAKYTNTYTNSYFFGAVNLIDSMALDLTIEPTENAAITNAVDTTN